MAKRPSVTSVGSGYTSPETLNQNFTSIVEQFDTLLSRDGSTPNSMTADLDLDSNDILNVDNLTVNGSIISNGKVVDLNNLTVSSGINVLYNSSALTTPATALDFTGPGVTVTGTGTTKTVYIPGGTSSGGTEGVESFKDTETLLADTETSYAVGTILTSETETTKYIVANPSETNPDITTAGGVKAFEIGPDFSDIYKLRGAVTRGDLRDGQRVTCAGVGFTVDSSATGLDSALWRFDVDGLRSERGDIDNLFLMSAFKNQENTAQYLWLSNDGVNLKRLNKTEILRGAGDATTGGRDSQPFWARQRSTDPWLMPVTAGEGLAYDFSIFVSKNLVTPYNVKLQITGTNTYGGIRDTLLPEATRAADLLWGPRLHNIGDKVYLTISARTQADYTDSFGNSSPTFRPYISECTDIENLTFAAPVAMDVSTSTTAMLEPDIVQAEDGTYWMCIKNSANRNIEIYSATDPITDTWTYSTTLSMAGSLEGSIWVEQVYLDATTGERKIKYRVHAANNRNSDNELTGVPVEFVSTDGPDGPYTSVQDVNNSHSMRNGDILNAALEPDPRCMASLLDLATSYAGEYPSSVDETIRLESGTDKITPQQDVMYYVNTAAYETTLTIENIEAKRFWLACLSSHPDTKINLVNDPNAVGNITIGGGAFRVVEVVYVDVLAKYVCVGDYSTASGGSGDGVADSLSFDSGTNVLTLGRSVGVDLTVDLSSLDGGSSDLISQTPSDGAKFIASGAPGNENTDAGELNLYPSGTDGVGIGVSRLGMAMSGGADLGYVEARNNATLEITVEGGISRYAGAVAKTSDLGAATDVDPSNGGFQAVTLTAARTLNLVNFLQGDKVMIRVDGADTHTLTIASPTETIKWQGGAAPSSFDAITLIGATREGGEIFLGALGF